MINLPPSIQSIDIQIPHRNWERALSESFALLIAAQPGDVVCIAGPSRAGKTRLIQELCRLITGGVSYEENGKMSAVVVEAANTGPNGTFSTKSFIHRMLEEVKHPIYSTANVDIENPFAYQKMTRVTEAQLRLALERALIWRGTKYLFIDEAQHAKYAAKRSHAGHAIMDSWKCLAQSVGIVLVIVGAYPVLDILRDSPHLLGRKHQVHFPRYHETLDDLYEFALILAHYDQVIEIGSGVQTLQEFNELLYAGSLGCIGLLRGWLTRATAIASIRGNGVTRDILVETIISNSDLKKIAFEIRYGEKVIGGGSFSEYKKELIKDKCINNNKPFKRKPKRFKKNNRTDRDNDDE